MFQKKKKKKNQEPNRVVVGAKRRMVQIDKVQRSRYQVQWSSGCRVWEFAPFEYHIFISAIAS